MRKWLKNAKSQIVSIVATLKLIDGVAFAIAIAITTGQMGVSLEGEYDFLGCRTGRHVCDSNSG